MLLNVPMVARRFQPEFPRMMVMILGYGKTWVVVLLGSFIAVLVDVTMEFTRVVFFPNPTDKIMSLINDKRKISDDSFKVSSSQSP